MFTADFPKSIIILGLSAKIKEKQKKNHGSSKGKEC
jgi:hypothetical protein